MWTRSQVEELYRRHGFAVFRRCRRLLRSEAEARDLAQEVFLKVVEKPEAFEGRADAGTYLYSMATFLCLKRMRDRRARGEEWQQSVGEQWDAARLPPVDQGLQARQILSAILAETDERTAEIAVYHFVDGIPQGEIAGLVGLSRVTVNQRLQLFRERARRIAQEAA
jgi:RNA polymerase sigma-70 factor, ECF subfamily